MAVATASAPPLKLYSAKVCPWAHRTTLALYGVGADWEKVEIDLQNKPSWYATKINPASKVPVLQFGTDDEGSTKIPESYVILEAIADLYSTTNPILPSISDPISRARSRYFVERFNQVISLQGIYLGNAKLEDLFKGVREVQGLLEAEDGKRRKEGAGGETGTGTGPFFFGERPGLADFATAPFLGRLYAFSKAEISLFKSSDFHRSLTTDPQYSRFNSWAQAIFGLSYWGETFDEPYIVEFLFKRLAASASSGSGSK